MGEWLRIVSPIHNAVPRDVYSRMGPHKPERMRIAKQYGKEYWSGNGDYGYNNYRYIPGKQTPIAEALIKQYGLTSESSVLDIGCGPGFLLYEFTQLLPGITVAGLDVSHYALDELAHPAVKDKLQYGRAEQPLPFGDEQFNLVVSINTLHNLYDWELPLALREIGRVGFDTFICVESYHDEESQTKLQCWALTCNTFMPINGWIHTYDANEHYGDYDFTEF